MANKRLLIEIRHTYGRDIFTLKELYDILQSCGFLRVEARNILKECLNEKALGQVRRRKVRNRMPARSSMVAILINV